MANNPYQFNRDVDADIFEDNEDKGSAAGPTPNGHKHTIDGSICPTCHRIHDFMGVDLTPAQEESLLEALDSVPGKIAAEYLEYHDQSRHTTSNLAYRYLHHAHVATTAVADIPMFIALLEVLDGITEGQASRVWRVYDAERELIAAHETLKELNNALAAEHSRADEKEYHKDEQLLAKHYQIVHVLGFMCDMMTDRITSLVKSYRGRCKNADVEPKDGVITSGTYSEDDARDLTQFMMQKIRLAAAKVFASD